MNPIQAFDPVANPSGVIKTNGVNKGEQILLYNSSLACLELEFADHTIDTLPPSWARDWVKSSPMSTIKYSTLFTLPVNGQPVSQLYGTLYEAGEHVAPVNTPLQYVYVVGNPGGVSTVNNTLINTGGVPGNNIVDIQPSDAASATITMDNAGNVVIKGDNAGVLTTLLQLIAGASPSVKLAATNVLTEILWNLQVDNHLIIPNNTTIQAKLANGTPADIMLLTSGNTLVLITAVTGNKIILGDFDGTNLATFSKSAIELLEVLTTPTPTATVLNASAGGTGSINIYQTFNKGYKKIFFSCSNFKNGSATLSFSFPEAFQVVCMYTATDVPGLQFMKSGVAQSFQWVNNVTNTTANGSTPAMMTFGSLFNNTGAFPIDSVVFSASNSTTHNGTLVVEGY